MILLITSFLAGALSVLAPCIITFIPIILARTGDQRRHSPVVVIASLAVSIIIFSILLKSTTLLLGVPEMVWHIISGSIVTLFGLSLIFPSLWEKLAVRLGFALAAQKAFAGASGKKGRLGDILIGASLGPVFSACSPTYALIVATILPAEPLTGFIYLLAYAAGLSLLLGLIAVFGRSLTSKLQWTMRPGSVFQRVLGMILLVLGLMIVFGIDKMLLAHVISQGWFDWQINLESGLAS